MKNNMVLLIWFCSLTVMVRGQEQVYFNERMDHFTNSDNARNIIETEDGYMVFGHTEDTIHNYFFHYTFTKLSSKGNVEWVKTYGDTINDFLEGQPGSMIKYSENKYFTCGYTSQWAGEEVSYCGYLLCLNNSFDTLWSKTYCQNNLPYDTTYVLHQLKKCEDGGLVFAGVLVTETDYSKIWLLKTDSLGNKQWERFFSDGIRTHQGHSVIQTSDGGYAIGCYKYKPGDSNSGDPLIIKTDSLGNEEWSLNPGSNLKDNKVMLALSNDGNIIAGTNYGYEPYGDNREAKNYILAIRNDGSIFFDRKYGSSLYDNYLTQIRVNENGHLIATGAYSSFTSDTPSSIGWLLCIDTEGNQKWYREYTNLDGDHSYNYLWDIIPTYDKGFIACGQVLPAVPDTGNPDIWVLKLDSLGNDTTTVGIWEEKQDKYPGMVISPSPVGKRFTLSLGATASEPLHFIFYNQFGLKVEELEIPKGQNEITVNAANWPGGLYVAVVKERGEIVGRRKFVVKK